MSLQETIEELRKERDAAIARENGELAQDVEEQVADFLPNEEDKEVDESPDKIEEKLQEPKEEPEKKLDDSAYARIRREKAAEKKRADELAAKLEELTRARQPESLTQQESERQESPLLNDPDIAAFKRERQIKEAEREFVSFEQRFKQTVPDYDAVASQYVQAIAQSIKIQKPRISDADLAEATRLHILQQAGQYVNNGFDPVEEMYYAAKELGFNGKPSEVKVKDEEIKPDMNKVAENRRKSTGMTGASGDSKPSAITAKQAAEFSPAEWMKLSAEQKKALLMDAQRYG